MLLVIDFEKAFDSVSHTLLHKVWDFFQLSPSFQKWIRPTLFYENTSSCVLLNSTVQMDFSSQGDPWSPYLFLLVNKILGILMRHSNSLFGLHLNRKTLKLLQYADANLFILNGTRQDLQCALEILADFDNMSNLKINIAKTQVAWVNIIITFIKYYFHYHHYHDYYRKYYYYYQVGCISYRPPYNFVRIAFIYLFIRWAV